MLPFPSCVLSRSPPLPNPTPPPLLKCFEECRDTNLTILIYRLFRKGMGWKQIVGVRRGVKGVRKGVGKGNRGDRISPSVSDPVLGPLSSAVV